MYSFLTLAVRQGEVGRTVLFPYLGELGKIWLRVFFPYLGRSGWIYSILPWGTSENTAGVRLPYLGNHAGENVTGSTLLALGIKVKI